MDWPTILLFVVMAFLQSPMAIPMLCVSYMVVQMIGPPRRPRF